MVKSDKESNMFLAHHRVRAPPGCPRQETLRCPSFRRCNVLVQLGRKATGGRCSRYTTQTPAQALPHTKKSQISAVLFLAAVPSLGVRQETTQRSAIFRQMSMLPFTVVPFSFLLYFIASNEREQESNGKPDNNNVTTRSRQKREKACDSMQLESLEEGKGLVSARSES